MVTAIKASNLGARATATLLAGTILSGVVAPAEAQTAAKPAAPATQPQAAPAPVAPAVVRTIKSLRVEGSQRIEPETVLSYTRLRVGDSYTNETVDQAIKDLLASELLADVVVEGVETGNLILRIRENPVINRVVFEGNKRLKQDKIDKEIKLRPRQIFTRTAVRADIARIIELYRRQGRFAARVEPKMVSLDQNRVDVIFEIHEGAKSKVRQINIIGNEVFGDKKLRAQMATKVASLSHFLSSNTSYDQDRLAYDQQKLRQFYLTEGYADFRVISAVAELTPDKKDFIITYVVEEGPRYKFGPVSVDSAIRDFDDKKLAAALPIKEGQWYNAKAVEDTVEQLSETAGLFGYAFADVRPDFQRNKDALTMSMNFHIGEANRTYVERVEITGNRQTQDKVIRREMRVAEGDAFNTFLVKRSQDRINSLGYFQDKFEIERKEGSAPDRIVLGANVEEKPNGELTLSAGFSSLERFILQASIRQRNFRGMGQTASISADYSSYSKSVELGFTEPYLFDSNIALGATIFRRDYNAFNYLGTSRNTTYQQVSTGFQLVAGLPLTEYWTLSGRYYLAKDNVTLDRDTFYTDGVCDPLKAGRYYCEAVGNRLTSLVGVSLIYDSLNSRLRPTRGQRVSLGADFAGLGGDVKYIRGKIDGAKYWGLGKGFVFSVTGEGGVIKSLDGSEIRITDRFYLGEPQFRGFDIRGVGPRVQRYYYNGTPTSDPSTNTQILNTARDQIVDDALGGKAYYLTKAELELPLGSGAAELGLRPSIYIMAGSLFSIRKPTTNTYFTQATDSSGKKLFNSDGSPTLLPKLNYQFDSNGKPVYLVSSGTYSGYTTACSVGYAAASTDPCVGTSVNSQYYTSTSPFYEVYRGSTASPRVSVGVGVNWNSPFGPLRIDVAKAIVSQPGDDKKLVTFNVGTQF
ncbi:outer membrane protein assembly factor BamA [Sphingomonas sp. R1]|uniref:outer membrane protein assembly factor BamA n=1 Tax=Sphingomonas sp. R1 TaxID=399176 RepID=UPI002224E4B2|nr:outer membrane protein assembly factor BamA [Sphingomonas sp. R1]UYY78071.1 outer membrane protein assembly factor BamA [Sphingomonas sp. R1]